MIVDDQDKDVWNLKTRTSPDLKSQVLAILDGPGVWESALNFKSKEMIFDFRKFQWSPHFLLTNLWREPSSANSSGK